MPAIGHRTSWASSTFHSDSTPIMPRITTVIATSPTPAMPEITHLAETIASLHYVPELADSPIIVAFDGAADPLISVEYEAYQSNVERAFARYSNLELARLPAWGHLSGVMERAMRHVQTEFVFVQQHDLPLIRSFDLDAVLACMAANPEVQHVRLNRRANLPVGWDRTPLFASYHTPQLTLTRTGCWSDQSHIASAAYYRTAVLPRLSGKRVFPEDIMNRLMRADAATLSQAHATLGTYIYGPPGEPPVIRHTDARCGLLERTTC